MIDTERKEDLFLDTKLIKSENKLGKLRIIDELHPVLGGQPTHEKDQPNDNNPFLDLACTMQFTIDKVNAVDKKADTKLAKAQNLKDVANVAIARDNLGLGTSATMNATSTLSDRTDQVATIKVVNDVNRSASTAQKTANTANDKANAAQNRADSAYSLAGKKWDIVNVTGYAPQKNADNYQAGEGGYVRTDWVDNVPKTGLDLITKSQYGSNDLLQIAFPQRSVLEFHMRTKSADGWSRWFEFYHTANTTIDKSGFLRASGSANAVITTDLATKSKAGITRLDSSLSDAEDRAATPKAVNDVNRAASTAQKTANTANDKANAAQTTANNADAKAVAAQRTADTGVANAKTAQERADAAFSRVKPIAEGGTGATTAPNARKNLGLGDASTRNVAESLESHENTLVPLGLLEPSIGYKQIWRDVSSQRIKDTAYLNDTGRPIQIMITTRETGGQEGIWVDQGNGFIQISRASAVSAVAHSLIIPPGAYYKCGANIIFWSELR